MAACRRRWGAAHHCYNLAINHQQRYLDRRGREQKRFLYHIRGLLAAKWVLGRGCYPPVPFRDLVDAEVGDTSVREALWELVRLKSMCKEHDTSLVPDGLAEYARSLGEQVRSCMEAASDGPHPSWDDLDASFLDTPGKDLPGIGGCSGV